MASPPCRWIVCVCYRLVRRPRLLPGAHALVTPRSKPANRRSENVAAQGSRGGGGGGERKRQRSGRGDLLSPGWLIASRTGKSCAAPRRRAPGAWGRAWRPLAHRVGERGHVADAESRAAAPGAANATWQMAEQVRQMGFAGVCAPARAQCLAAPRTRPARGNDCAPCAHDAEPPRKRRAIAAALSAGGICGQPPWKGLRAPRAGEAAFMQDAAARATDAAHVRRRRVQPRDFRECVDVPCCGRHGGRLQRRELYPID